GPPPGGADQTPAERLSGAGPGGECGILHHPPRLLGHRPDLPDPGHSGAERLSSAGLHGGAVHRRRGGHVVQPQPWAGVSVLCPGLRCVRPAGGALRNRKPAAD
ncbi:Cysteine-rich CPCC domain-containing protein, partial [Dysosmobacter welbionis]